MIVPPADFPPAAGHSGPRIRHLIRWALLLLVATILCVSASRSEGITGHVGWLQLAALLSAAGAIALLSVAGIRYRRHETASLFRVDCIADQAPPPVVWSTGKQR